MNDAAIMSMPQSFADLDTDINDFLPVKNLSLFLFPIILDRSSQK